MSQDGEAWVRALERYRGPITAHCYRMLGSLQDAEEVTQDTLLRGWQKRDDVTDERAQRAWLFAVATRRCLDALRKKRGRRAAGAADGGDWVEPAPDAVFGFGAQSRRRAMQGSLPSPRMACARWRLTSSARTKANTCPLAYQWSQAAAGASRASLASAFLRSSREVALVTGANRGLGRAIVEALLRANVVKVYAGGTGSEVADGRRFAGRSARGRHLECGIDRGGKRAGGAGAGRALACKPQRVRARVRELEVTEAGATEAAQGRRPWRPGALMPVGAPPHPACEAIE